MSDENENIVPEATAANANLGAPSLDADRIDASTDSLIDSLLDQAEDSQSNQPPEIPDEPDDKEKDIVLDDLDNTPTTTTPENVNTPEPVETPSVETTPISTSETEIDPEIAAIEQPRNLSESNQSNWKKLQETATQYKKQAVEAEQLRQRVQELEQRPTQTPTDYEELKKFRAIFDTENDPEFKSKYDVPIQSAKENIYNILKKNGASDDVIKSIEDAGGPDKISQEWWKKQAIDRLPLTDAERLKKNLVDVIDLKENRVKEIGDTAEKREEFLQNRQNALIEKYHTSQQEIYQYTSELTKDIPWAQYRQVDPSLPADKLEEIKKHNAGVDLLSQQFDSALWPKTSQERAEVAAAAVASRVLSEQLRYEQTTKVSMQQKLDAVTKELTALKNAGRVPKANPTPANVQKTSSVQDRIKMNASDAIDLGLDEASGD
jgi:hypothetical protein